MALGINYESGGGEDIVPVLKYDGRAGRLFRMDREDGSTSPVDITSVFQAMFDFENVETGTISFQAGQAPSFCVVPLGKAAPPPPTPKHKPGVRIIVKLNGESAGGQDPIREMASTAKVFLHGLDDLHNEYMAGKDANPGKLPVVILKSTVPITSEGKDDKGQLQKSTNYKPVWEIKTWAKRPDDLVPMFRTPAGAEAAAAAPAAQAAPAASKPASTGASRAAPPPAAAPATADEDEWG